MEVASSASPSHQIMGTEVRGLGSEAPSLFFLLGSVQTSTLSALSDSQTAEVWDPLPDLPISSHRNSTNEALWGTDAGRAAWTKTTCHSHLMVTHTQLCHKGLVDCLFVCVCIYVKTMEQFCMFMWILIRLQPQPTKFLLTLGVIILFDDSFFSPPLSDLTQANSWLSLASLFETVLRLNSEKWERNIQIHFSWLWFLHISGTRGALSAWCVISGSALPFRTIYPSFSMETKRFIITVQR